MKPSSGLVRLKPRALRAGLLFRLGSAGDLHIISVFINAVGFVTYPIHSSVGRRLGGLTAKGEYLNVMSSSREYWRAIAQCYGCSFFSVCSLIG